MSLWRTIILAVNLVATRFAGAAIGLASQILLARLLSQNDVGIIFLGMSAASVVSLVITGGYPTLAITCLPRYLALGRSNLVRAFHAAFLHDSLWISLATFSASAMVYFWLPFNDGIKTALLFGCLSAPAAAAIRINSSAANSVRRYTLSYVPDFIYRPGLLLAFLLVAWWLGIDLSVVQVLWVFVIAMTLVAVAQAWVMGWSGAISGFKWSGRHNLAPVLRGRAAALVIVGTVAATFADMVTLIAGFFLDSAEVALVGVAIRLAALAGFIAQAAQQFILPDLAAALARGASQQVHAILLRINSIALVAILACIVGALLLGALALRVFGAEYEAGYWPLILFMFSQAFRGASGMNQHLLSLAGYQIRTAGSCLLAVVVLIGGAALLSPVLGVIGFALAVLIADGLWAALLALQAQRLTGRRGDIIGLVFGKKS